MMLCKSLVFLIFLTQISAQKQNIVCTTQLGMQDGSIVDDQLTVSSSSPGKTKQKARFGCCKGEANGAWCPASSDKHPYYEVSFKSPQTVGGIMFQHPSRANDFATHDTYMTSFELKYISALDSLRRWLVYNPDNPSIYNSTTAYNLQLVPPVVVTAVKFYPKQYIKAPCFRFELLGCDPKALCPQNYCQNGGTCMGVNLCKCNGPYYGDQCQRRVGQLTPISIAFTQIVQNILQSTFSISFKVFGNVILETTTIGKVIHLQGKGSYIQMNNSDLTSCLRNINSCTSGFTLSLNVKFTTLTDNTYIISSGGDLHGFSGISLFYSNETIHYYVTTTTHTWRIKVKYTPTLNVWHKIELSWNRHLGSEIVDNGVLIGSVSSSIPLQTAATQTLPLQIGFGNTNQDASVNFQVATMQIYEANRGVLIDNALITSTVKPPTTTITSTTSTSTTTTSTTTRPTTTKSFCESQKNDLSFQSIQGNMIYTPSYNFTVYKSPTLHPENDGSAFLELKSRGQYLELPNVGLQCIQDMTTCDHGFTLSVEIKFHDLNSTDKLYIFSSGGDKVNNSGIALYIWKGELYCSAKKDHAIWTGKKMLNVNVGEWHTYQVSWNKQDGFIVYLDGNKFMDQSVRLPNPAQNGKHPLLIASSPGYSNTALMDVRHLYTWSSSRDELIQSGCIQEYTTHSTEPTTIPTTSPTTPKTTTPSNTTPQIPVFNWVFANIKQNVSVVDNITTTLHSVTVNTTDQSILFSNPAQYIDLDTHNLVCLSHLQLCKTGITIKIEIKFYKLEENTIVFTTGSTIASNVGITILYRYGHLTFMVSNQEYSWYVLIGRDQLPLNQYHTVILSWSTIYGLQTVIDNLVVGTSSTPIHHSYFNMTTGHTYIGHPSGCGCNTDIDFSIKSLTIYYAWIQICIDGGLLPPVKPVPTTTVAPPPTTPKKTTTAASSTEYCHSGFVCKDSLTTMSQPATTLKPTTRTTLRPTQRPTTPKPTTTTPTPTTTTPSPTTTTPTTTTTTTPRPTTPAVPIYTTVPILIAGNTPTGTPALQCTVSAAQANNVEFTVCLNIGSISCAVEKKVSGKTQIIYFTAQEVNQNILNTKVTCSVKAKFVGHTIWTVTYISRIFTPIIQVTSPSPLTLVEGHYPHYDLHVHTNVPPQMFCCKSCKGRCSVTITTHIISGRHVKYCARKNYIPQVVVGWAGERQSQKPEACGTYISAASWTHNITIPITATADGIYDRDHTVVMGVQASIDNYPPGGNVIATPVTINVGKVSVTAKDNDHKGYCSSVNDPHITTFDGTRYDNFNEGEFILYRHKSLPFEVRAIYKKCSSKSRATCNCAAAVKTGDDVFVFSACGGSSHSSHHSIFDLLFRKHGHGHDHGHSQKGLLVDLYKNGELTPGTYIKRFGCGQKYEVLLPTGTKVTVQSSSRSFMNIYIQPSSLDRRQVEGLCGNFNGIKSDDIDRKYGYKINERYPNRFCSAWRPSSTIFHGVRPSTLPGITTYCSCIDKRTPFCVRGYGRMICYDTRYDITETIVKQAKVPQLTGRHKRAVDERTTDHQLDLFEAEDDSFPSTFEDMKDYCRDYITNSTASKQCSTILNATNFDERIENCARDMNDTQDNVWATDSVKDIISECLTEAERSTPMVDNSTATPTESPVSALENLTASLCDQDCGPHGQCNGGVCQCNNGYTGDLCEISKATKPIVLQSLFDGDSCDTCGCDVQDTANCSTVVVYGSNFVESDTLTCFYRYVEVTDTVKVVSGYRQVAANYVNLHQVTCNLPEGKGGALVRVSNDGVTRSDNEYLHVIYDSRCYDCFVMNETMTSYCKKRDNVCFINGGCYTSDDAKPSDQCRICEPSTNPHSWTISAKKDCTTEYLKVQAAPKSDSSSITVTVLAVVCAFLAVLLLAAVYYICKKKESADRKGQSGKYEINPDPMEKKDLDKKM